MKFKTFDLTYSNKGSIGRLNITGIITSFPWDDSEVSANDVVKRIGALGTISRLDIHIHSPGGSIVEGLAIFSALQQVSVSKHYFIDGVAGSMASIFSFAGGTRHIASNAWIMIHNPTAFASGSSEQLRRIADQNDRFKEQMRDIYSNGSNLSADESQAAMDVETWYNAEEALANGFVDVIEGEVLTDIAASMEGNRYTNVPEILREQHQNVRGTPPNESTEEVDEMTVALTLAILMADHSDIFAEAQAAVDLEGPIAEAVATAINEERTRIQGVLALAADHTGIDDLISPLAYDGKTTPEQAALKVMQYYKDQGVSLFDQAKADANKRVKPDGTGDDGLGGSGDRPSDDDPKAQAEYDWENNIDGVRSGPDSFNSKDDFLAYAKGASEGRLKGGSKLTE